MLNALKIFVYILTYSELTPLVANFLREAIYRNIKLFLLLFYGVGNGRPIIGDLDTQPFNFPSFLFRVGLAISVCLQH